MTTDDQAFLNSLTAYFRTVTHKGLEQAEIPIPASTHELEETNELAAAFKTFAEQLHTAYRSYLKIAAGDLSEEIPRRHYLAMPAKAIQADLKHLTWQTQRIADGDLNQTVHYMGDFSIAFNRLVDALKTKVQLEQELHAVLQERATTDVLTGLRNRQHLDSQLALEINRSERYGTLLSFILFDIDHFKLINDQFGHLAGDSVLKELAATVGTDIRKLDIFARWGGEEFVIVLPGCDLKSAMLAAEKLRVRIENHLFDDGLRVTCSFGVSQYRAGDTSETITARADNAMYASKKYGRNRVTAETL